MKPNSCAILHLFLAAALCLLPFPAFSQTSMPVANSDFETGTLAGWLTVASGGYGSGAGVINNVTNQSAQYPNFSNPLPGTASGTYFGPGTVSTYYASLCGYPGNPAEVLYQDVTTNGLGNPGLQPNTTYTFTVAVGVGRYSNVNSGYISLINGTNPTGTVLATANFSTLGFTNDANNFKDLTVTFTTGNSVSGDLTIAIGCTGGYPSANSIFLDNVRLTRQSPNISVVNSSFETGDLTGWTTVASGGYGSGVYAVNTVTNQSAQYPNFSNPLPGTAAGIWYGVITGYNGNSPEMIYQDVSANGQGNAPLQPNTTYTLTVALGAAKYTGISDGFIELINGTNTSGTVLATASMSSLGMSNYSNNFKDLTVTFTTGNSVSGDLTIAIGTPYGYPSNTHFYADNVRLTQSAGPETVGGGSIASAGSGPRPSFGIGGSGFTLVKNWHFGTNGTIKNMTDMNTEFQYHDQFNTYRNPNYGAKIVSSDVSHALSGQPYEGQLVNGVAVPAVRTFFADYLQTYLVPLGGATTVTPSSFNTGSGSFQAKWTLPHGGSLLGQDVVWETRVRYVTPPYFWFAIWNSGNQWSNGAEMDLIESFGYDNGGGSTNFLGKYWHSNSVNGSDKVSYGSWGNGMSSVGITNFDATQYHIWTLAYYKDNTYAFYVDGVRVQYGASPYYWTYGATSGGTPINMSFLFDGTWGSTSIPSVNHSLAASALSGTYYEWNYSRVYLRN